jgi:outer membrane protein OmpA-like peptidoglycan-associated protein
MNVIQLLLGALTPGLVQKLASLLGESPDATQKGIGAAIPVVLGSLIGKGSTEAGAGQLIEMINQSKVTGGVLENLGDLFGGGEQTQTASTMGGSILKSLLGDKLGPLAGLIGGASGMKAGGVEKLLGLAAPLVLGGLMKGAPAGGFTPASLLGLLVSQKEHVAKAAPPGLGALLGIAGLEAPAAGAMPTPPAAVVDDKKGGGILPWLLGAAVIAAIAFFGPKMCTPEAPKVEAPTVEIPALPTLAELTLPGGVKLSVNPGSIGEQLFNFLNGSETGAKTFVFDGLTFETGSANLTAESNATVEAITQILKAFPTAKVSVDGYTDNTGGLRANQRLSEARAKTVADKIIAGGVEGARVSFKGHGPEKPIADNATAEGQEKNRRVELTAMK